MSRHSDNVKIIEAYLMDNKKRAYSRQEIADNTGVSLGAVRSILRDFREKGKVEYHKVKERNGELRAYYNWKRCDHLAARQCVIREKDCALGRDCCLFCNRRKECDLACSISIMLMQAEEE